MAKEFLYVYLNNNLSGFLNKEKNNDISFIYDNNANQALSLSLPLKKRAYSGNECQGFFNGLLPENESVRAIIGKKYGISPKNDFSMLKAIGYDCAGAISFFEEEQKHLKEFYDIKGNILSDEQLEKYINDLPQKPLSSANDKRLSLAGAQDKTAVMIIDNQIALAEDNVPTTHILKPAVPYYKETIENEYICLKAAQKLGINIPEIKIGTVKNTKYFLIKRYDREIINEQVKRIHQEDFCQASNIISANKYQSEGGVGFKRCFEILKQTTYPAVSIKQFVEIMIFNFLIGNNDAHSKNFSILHYDNGNIEFAPAYDILCSTVYPELTDKMAMKIGGYYKFEEIYPRHFEKLANDADISYTQLKKTIKKQCEILPDIFKTVIEECDNTIGKDILNIVQKNCLKTTKRFGF